MKIKSIALFFLLCLPSLLIGQRSLDLKEIRFIFQAKEVNGSIGDFQSSSVIKLDEIGESSFKGSVSVSSLKTGNFLRDWALKGRKYFDESQFPRILFESEKVIETTKGIEVNGQLTMKGITKPLTINFQIKDNMLSGKAYLYTSDYDISIKKKREDNKVEITLLFMLR